MTIEQYARMCQHLLREIHLLAKHQITEDCPECLGLLQRVVVLSQIEIPTIPS